MMWQELQNQLCDVVSTDATLSTTNPPSPMALHLIHRRLRDVGFLSILVRPS
jgi:hypothetical protein